MKRAFDLTVALLLGVLLIPVFALVAGAVRIWMGGPVLFHQSRVGRHGQVFTIVKFRTMRPTAFPGEDDAPRIPRAGRALRASSLDELPQLWNIFRGQMSLIGPRPTLPEQVELYSDYEWGRLAVRPGLTGWAQVSGRNANTWPERIELDLWYIANRTPILDARILVRTVKVALQCRNVVGTGGLNPGFPGPRAPLDPTLTSGAAAAEYRGR